MGFRTAITKRMGFSTTPKCDTTLLGVLVCYTKAIHKSIGPETLGDYGLALAPVTSNGKSGVYS